MDTDDTINNASTPPDDGSAQREEPQPQTDSIWREPIFAVPAIGWCALSVYWLWQVMPFFFAIPAGCVLGMTLFFLTSALVGGGVSTLQELGCGGIISLVLALIITPVFPAARAKARQTACMTNVKAASLALLLYAQDNDERFPPADHWQAAARTYLPQAQKQLGSNRTATLRCPSAPASPGYGFYTPLAANSCLLFDPAATPLLFDADVSAATIADLPQSGRHEGKNVVGFADGHVRWQKPTETTAATPPASRLYNKRTKPNRRRVTP